MKIDSKGLKSLMEAGKLVGAQGELWRLFTKCDREMQIRFVRSGDLKLKYIEITGKDASGSAIGPYCLQVKEAQSWQEVFTKVVSNAINCLKVPDIFKRTQDESAA